MIKEKWRYLFLESIFVTIFIIALCSYGVYRMSGLIGEAKEGVARGNLGSLRAALRIYYSDNEDFWPRGNLDSLIPKYIRVIPEIDINNQHYRSRFVRNAKTNAISDTGEWLYDDVSGGLSINCAHLDLKGRIISSW